MNAADIVLLLVSPDFIASDYCYDVEMTRALERHRLGEARIIPVILRPYDWQGAPLGQLMAVPKDGKPVTRHQTLDDGFLEVAKAIRQVAGLADTSAAVARRPDPPAARPDMPMPGPRSGNLRIRTEFTDRDRHGYLNEAFEYIARYFENSAKEIQARNEHVETDFRRVDANGFEARAFVGGREQAVCGIWRGNLIGHRIHYSSSGLDSRNSFNESMSVSDDGYTLFLQPRFGIMHFDRPDPQLTMEGAAEHLWSLFIEPLR